MLSLTSSENSKLHVDTKGLSHRHKPKGHEAPSNNNRAQFGIFKKQASSFFAFRLSVLSRERYRTQHLGTGHADSSRSLIPLLNFLLTFCSAFVFETRSCRVVLCGLRCPVLLPQPLPFAPYCRIL